MIFLNYIVYYRHGANWAATKVSKSNIKVLLRFDKLFLSKDVGKCIALNLSALRLKCIAPPKKFKVPKKYFRTL